MVTFTNPTFEFWSLAITRFSTAVISLWAISVVLKVLLAQDKNPLKRLLPRPVLLFTLFWLSSLLCITSYLVMAGSAPIQYGWVRALYGTSFAWSIAGLAWIIALGRKTVTLLQAAQEVERVVKK